MNEQSPTPRNSLRIKTPCPKSWDELEGAGPKRFCSECSLHVHDASQLTRSEAERLVAESTQRVCMRMQFDSKGAPIYSDSLSARATRWALAAAAGLLAACDRAAPTAPSTPPSNAPTTGQCTTTLGEVEPAELIGDVALPDPEPRVLLGGVEPVAPPDESSSANSPTPRDH